MNNSIYYILPKIKSNIKPEIKFKDILKELGIEYIQSFKLKNKFLPSLINIVLSTIFFLLPQYYPSDTINIFDVITFNSLKMA